MARFQKIILTLSLASHCHANANGNGLIGYGKYMYYPLCAASCRGVIEGSALTCTPHTVEEGGGHSHGSTPPECHATDLPFMQTLALCISQRCSDEYTADILETYWRRHEVNGGRPMLEPRPSLSYANALESIKEMPTEVYIAGEMLNKTSVISDYDWQSQWNALGLFEEVETGHQTLSLVVLLCGFVTPVAFSLLRFVPFSPSLRFRLNAIFNYPALIGSRHRSPIIYGLGIMPTRGQAFFIGYLVLLNLLVCAVDYHPGPQPNAWFPDTWSQVVVYMGDRTGAIAFANLGLLFLYSARNNLLLWITDWSHTTYLHLHRWVGYVAILEACVHSLALLHYYIKVGSYSVEVEEPYWYWGIIATLSMAIIWPLSCLQIRRALYEFFLLSHIVLTVLTLVGCYLHIWFLYKHYWGYEIWIYTAGAVWGADRVIRIWRTLRNGLRRGRIEKIGDDYVRVEIEGIVAHGHVYIYFPTLSWRFWENHPFSVASSFSGRPRFAKVMEQARQVVDEEKSVNVAENVKDESGCKSIEIEPSLPGTRLTVLVRIRGGLTAKLIQHVGESVPVLVESSYHNSAKAAQLSECTTLICIAGGVGISSVLPIAHSHPGPQVRLYWGMRHEFLKDALTSEIAGLDIVCSVGQRLDLASIISEELSRKDEGGKVGIIVSGPPGMADDARRYIHEIGAAGKGVRDVVFWDEAFSW